MTSSNTHLANQGYHVHSHHHQDAKSPKYKTRFTQQLGDSNQKNFTKNGSRDYKSFSTKKQQNGQSYVSPEKQVNSSGNYPQYSNTETKQSLIKLSQYTYSTQSNKPDSISTDLPGLLTHQDWQHQNSAGIPLQGLIGVAGKPAADSTHLLTDYRKSEGCSTNEHARSRDYRQGGIYHSTFYYEPDQPDKQKSMGRKAMLSGCDGSQPSAHSHPIQSTIKQGKSGSVQQNSGPIVAEMQLKVSQNFKMSNGQGQLTGSKQGSKSFYGSSNGASITNGVHKTSIKKQNMKQFNQTSDVSHNYQLKKAKGNTNYECTASSSVSQKPKQLQYEYGEGMANIVNGIGSYKMHLSNFTNNSSAVNTSNNFNSKSEKRREEKQAGSTKLKNHSKKPGRRVIAPVPFVVDEDSIRATDGSAIGSGLIQIRQGSQKHSKFDNHRNYQLPSGQNQKTSNVIGELDTMVKTKMNRNLAGQNNLGLKQSTVISNASMVQGLNQGVIQMQNQGFIQVRPILEGQSGVGHHKIGPLKQGILGSQSPGTMNRAMPVNTHKNKGKPLDPIESMQRSGIDPEFLTKQTQGKSI